MFADFLSNRLLNVGQVLQDVVIYFDPDTYYSVVGNTFPGVSITAGQVAHANYVFRLI